jgi:hypothetical protein
VGVKKTARPCLVAGLALVGWQRVALGEKVSTLMLINIGFLCQPCPFFPVMPRKSVFQQVGTAVAYRTHEEIL